MPDLRRQRSGSASPSGSPPARPTAAGSRTSRRRRCSSRSCPGRRTRSRRRTPGRAAAEPAQAAPRADRFSRRRRHSSTMRTERVSGMTDTMTVRERSNHAAGGRTLDRMSAVNSATYRARRDRRGRAACVDRSERGKLALTGADAKAFLARPGDERRRGLEPGDGCYAALLTPKGRMLGDLRVLDTGDELLLDMERAALQAIFNVHPPRDHRLRRRAAQAHAPARAAVARRPATRGRSPAPTDLPADRARATRPRRSTASAARVIATDVGVDVLCDAGGDHRRCARRAARGAAPSRSPRRRSTCCASRPGARATASTSTRRDPAGGRAQRARRLVHEGLLRRPGDGRAPALQGQAEPPSARAAAVRAGARRRRAVPRRARGRAAGSVADSPAHGPIGLALVRREAGVGEVLRVEDGDVTATVAELPFGLPPGRRSKTGRRASVPERPQYGAIDLARFQVRFARKWRIWRQAAAAAVAESANAAEPLGVEIGGPDRVRAGRARRGTW